MAKKFIAILVIIFALATTLSARNLLSVGMNGTYDSTSSSFGIGPYLEYNVLAKLDVLDVGIGSRIDITFSLPAKYWTVHALIGPSLRIEIGDMWDFSTLLGMTCALFSPVDSNERGVVSIGGGLAAGFDIYFTQARNMGLYIGGFFSLGVEPSTMRFPIIYTGGSIGFAFKFDTPSRGRGGYHDRGRYSDWDTYGRWY